MSYCVFPYAVKEDQLKALCSGSEAHRLPELLAQSRQAIEANRAWRARSPGTLPMDLEQALRQWLDGKLPVPNNAQHVYALELICRFIGTRLSSSFFDGYRGNYLQAIDASLGPALEGFSLVEATQNGPPPWLVSGWKPVHLPNVGHVEAERIRRLAPKVKDIEVTADSAEVEDAAVQVLSWIQSAAADGRTLILFEY